MGDEPVVDPQFAKNVNVYLETCDEIDAARKELKIIIEEKVRLEGLILDYMKNNDIPEIETKTGNKIRFRKSKVVKPLKQDSIREVLEKILDSSEKAEIMTKAIFENREYSETERISRIKPRVKKNKVNEE